MRAMVAKRYGPPEVLESRHMPDPVPRSQEAVLRVRAIGVNFADLFARMGLYPGTPKPPFVPGLEVSGTVLEAPKEAPEAPSFHKGDRVVALVHTGGYAERVAAAAAQMFRLPDNISFPEGASLPVNYLTAYHATYVMGNLQPGDRILIHGAAGGVGVAAIQLAKTRGLVVFGTAGPAKQEFLRQTGIAHPIDYTRENFVDFVRKHAPDGIEMVMDPQGGKSLAQGLPCLGPTGRLVTYGFSSLIGPGGKSSWWRIAKAYLGTPRLHPLFLMSRNLAVIGVHLGRMARRGELLRREMAEIFRMVRAGEVKPVIAKTFPLAEAAAAHRFLHKRQNIGKVILLPVRGAE